MNCEVIEKSINKICDFIRLHKRAWAHLRAPQEEQPAQREGLGAHGAGHPGPLLWT